MPDARENRGAAPRQAAALRYESGDNAPKVTAIGRGYVADRIIAAAREMGVPVRSDPASPKALAAPTSATKCRRSDVPGRGEAARLGLPARRYATSLNS